MTAYADYAFYTDEYLGRVISTEKDFTYFALRATEIIDSKTFGRIEEATDAVKRACCAAADELYTADTARAKAVSGISSESVDGYSVSYRAYDAKCADESAKRVDDAVKRCLAHTGLMYRGCGE